MDAKTPVRLIVGYDGSPPANAAIAAGGLLFPGAHAWITHLWTPPFASEPLRHRLWHGNSEIDEFVAAIEREGEWEAGQFAATGVALAAAAGWTAEPLIRRSYGGEGLQFTGLAAEFAPDLVLVGSRGLGGARAVLGSVSDMVVHYTSAPVLVVPYPLLVAEHTDLAAGPVVVGWDGSAGAEAARITAERLFPYRKIMLACAGPRPEQGPMPVVHLPGGGSPREVAHELVGCAREHGAALLVVGSRGRSVVHEILLGSTAMATLHHAHRATLVVPNL